MATIIRQLTDAFLAIRERENDLSKIPSSASTSQHHDASHLCDEQTSAIKGAILREPPQNAADLRPLLIAAADELETLLSIQIEGVTGAVESTLAGILIALEHAVIHPALGPVSAGDEDWNVPLYRKRAEARLIDPSQVQQPEKAA